MHVNRTVLRPAARRRYQASGYLMSAGSVIAVGLQGGRGKQAAGWCANTSIRVEGGEEGGLDLAGSTEDAL